MAEEKFRVVFTERAWSDLEDIVDYWTNRNEPERGERYAHDLPNEAIRSLSIPFQARSGRHLLRTAYPEIQELALFKRSYRILYLVKQKERTVEVLRFGTAIVMSRFRETPESRISIRRLEKGVFVRLFTKLCLILIFECLLL